MLTMTIERFVGTFKSQQNKIGSGTFSRVFGLCFKMNIIYKTNGVCSLGCNEYRHSLNDDFILGACHLWPFLLIWYNFNPSMDK